MNISIVTETYPPEVNGVAMTLSNITREFGKIGINVSLVRPKQAIDFGYSSIAPHQELIVRALPIPGYDELNIGLCNQIRLLNFWTKNRPDIVYIATEGPLGYVALKTAKRMGIPISSGFHTNFHEYMEHYKVPLLKGLMQRFLRNFHNQTRATFVPSETMRNTLTQDRYNNVMLMGRGVNTELFSPKKRSSQLRKEWKLESEDIAVLYVGRVASEKNIPLAIQAFEKIKEIKPKSQFIIVGDGPEREHLQELYPNLIFAGMQRSEQLARYYASSDLFLFPSTTETYGNVVPEAMASGLITVAFDYAAPKQLIKYNQNGFTAQFLDNPDFIRQTLRAIEEKSRWESISQKARSKALEYSWQSVANQFLKDLKSLI